MATFDQNFQRLQQPFYAKFNKRWNEDPMLFLQYIQVEYSHTIAELMQTGLNQVLNNQRDVKESLQWINKKLDR